mgnify:CR=1 FL=1
MLRLVLLGLFFAYVRGQRTQLVQETCTYSFVVPRPVDAACKGSASDDDDVLEVRLSQLENNLLQLKDDRISTLEDELIQLRRRLTSTESELQSLKFNGGSGGGGISTVVMPAGDHDDYNSNYTYIAFGRSTNTMYIKEVSPSLF